jgi:mono/diheme cytochrome c family protein
MPRSTLQPLRTRRLSNRLNGTLHLPRPAARPVVSVKTRQTLGAIGAIWLAFAASASAAAPAEVAPEAANPRLERGRYLVEHIGLCADCHSPRNEKGEFRREAWLKGSPLPFQPLVPMPWSPAAPQIAGLPSMTEAQAVTFLQTGKRADGSSPLPPMPVFRFNEDDARAVVAYLKSLAK